MNPAIPRRLPVFLMFATMLSCSTLTAQSVAGDLNEGYAVYYADSLHGNRTASGEKYDKAALTAAHRTLPFNTVVRVTNLNNRRSVQLRINDRGPFNSRKRIIDLSRAAAERVDMIGDGIVPVRVEIVSVPSSP